MMMNLMPVLRSALDVRRSARCLALVLAVVLAAGLCSGAMAQAAAGDPPGRVARLADLSGPVWVYTPEGGDWIAAARNQPLTTGDRLATDAGARAELRVGSTTLRLDGSSELEVVQLDDSQVVLQLHSGSLAARIRSAEAARELFVGTDDGGFRIEQPGRYRFDHLNSVSGVTVYGGQAAYEGDKVALTVTSGQHAEFWIDPQQVAQYALSAVVQDAFYGWVNERDSSDDRYAVPSYVSPEMTGAEDLARYGNWEQTPEDGAVWVPSGVAADWAPYSTGHWAFVRPWGWTWIDDAPWGFAPFHYGRWLRAHDRWCWAPGGFVARPIYAPALVAWVGGVGVSVAVGGPPVGWFPLAPRDVYVPSYRYSQRYVREINITNVTNVTQINRFVNLPAAQREYGNRRFPNAVTVVPASVMTGRQPVGPAAASLRGTPWVRELAAQPARVQTLAAAPVAAPAPARRVDPRTIQPPFAAAREAGRARPDMRPDMRPEARPNPPGQPLAQRPLPGAPVQAQPERPATAPVAHPAPPAVGRPATPAGINRPPQIEERRPLQGASPPMGVQRAPAQEEREPSSGSVNDPRITRLPQRNDEPRVIPGRPMPQRSEPTAQIPQRPQAEPRQPQGPPQQPPQPPQRQATERQPQARPQPQPQEPPQRPQRPQAEGPRPAQLPGRPPESRPQAPSANRADPSAPKQMDR